MHRFFRAFLVWVMVIAMPVQGMATSAMVVCGPSHERMTQGLMLDAPGVASSRAAHGHDDSAMDHGVHQGEHVHPASGGPVADLPSAGADVDGTVGLFPHHGKFSCSACAACCSALALPASFVLPEPSTPVHLVRMASVEPVASHQPDGLERPPRTILA